MKTLQSLKELGLGEKEQQVYFALLQLERATANQIAYKASIKRPTTYDILYGLKQEGFIYESQIGKKRYFLANSPENLVGIIEEKKRNLLKDLPELVSIYNTKTKKPKVAYFEGIDGVKQLFEDTLISLKTGDEILAYVTNDAVKFMEQYSEDYVVRRVEKGIKLRGIYNTSTKMAHYLRKNKEQLRTAKIVNQKILPFKNEINIFADKMIIITYSPEPFGVLIESKEVADTQRAIFELAWRGIK